MNVKWSRRRSSPADRRGPTFQLMQQNKALLHRRCPITGVTTIGADSVTISFLRPEFTNIAARRGKTWIVPSTSGARRATHPRGTDPNADRPRAVRHGSVPAQASRSSEQSYWGGFRRYPGSFPAYSSNDVAVDRALTQGVSTYCGNNVQQHSRSSETFCRSGPGHLKQKPLLLPCDQPRRSWVRLPQVWPSNQQAVRLAVSGGCTGSSCPRQVNRYEPAATSVVVSAAAERRGECAVEMQNDLKPAPDADKGNSIIEPVPVFAKRRKGCWARKGQEVAFQVEDPTVLQPTTYSYGAYHLPRTSSFVRATSL